MRYLGVAFGLFAVFRGSSARRSRIEFVEPWESLLDLGLVDPSEEQCVDVLKFQAEGDWASCDSFEVFSSAYGGPDRFQHEAIRAFYERDSQQELAELQKVLTRTWDVMSADMMDSSDRGDDGTREGILRAFDQAKRKLKTIRAKWMGVDWAKCHEDPNALTSYLCDAFAYSCELEVVPVREDDGKVTCTEDDHTTTTVWPYDLKECDSLCPGDLVVNHRAPFCSRTCSFHARGLKVEIAEACCIPADGSDAETASTTSTTTTLTTTTVPEEDEATTTTTTSTTTTVTTTTTVPEEDEATTTTTTSTTTTVTTTTTIPEEEAATTTITTTTTTLTTTVTTTTTTDTITTTTTTTSVTTTTTTTTLIMEMEPMSREYFEQLDLLDVNQRFEHFTKSWTSSSGDGMTVAIRDIVLEWRQLMKAIEEQVPGEVQPAEPFAPDEGSLAFGRLLTWKPADYKGQRLYHNDRRSELRKRLKWQVYQPQRLAGKRVLVVGGGPGGLRTAIEARLNGAQVTLLDSRERMTRMNVLLIWDFTRQDLLSLGLKDMYGDFCTSGDKQTVPISYLQHGLLRVALVLGVDVRPACYFAGFELETSAAGEAWVASTSCVMDPWQAHGVQNELLPFDIVFDASGSRGKAKGGPASQDMGHGPVIPVKPMMTKQAANFAVTANFKRFQGDTRDQFAIAQHFKLTEFRKKEVLLDNIVYFRAPSQHYLVATVKDEVLLEKKVVKVLMPDLLLRSNVDDAKLEELVMTIAEDWDIPHSNGFYLEGPQTDGSYKKSFSIFEFTKMMQATEPFVFLNTSSGEESQQVVAAVGDSLLSPFWPEGTGANRAIVGSMQQTLNYILVSEALKIADPSKRANEITKATDMAKKRYAALKASEGGEMTVCSYQSFVLSLYDGRNKEARWHWPQERCGVDGGPMDRVG